jgi:hypothetical protein
MARADNPLRIPAALRADVAQIFAFTDSFCSEHLDAEYGGLVRKLVAKLARKRPSPLARGDLRIWAAAAIHVVGSVNFLFDRSQRPHLTGDDLSALTGVPKGTIANKAKLIRDVLRIGKMEPELCRRELLASNPIVWMVWPTAWSWTRAHCRSRSRRRRGGADCSPICRPLETRRVGEPAVRTTGAKHDGQADDEGRRGKAPRADHPRCRERRRSAPGAGRGDRC